MQVIRKEYVLQKQNKNTYKYKAKEDLFIETIVPVAEP